MNNARLMPEARPAEAATETTEISCFISVVEPLRGDLYVVSTRERDVLVIVDKGIACRPAEILFTPWTAQQRSDGAIVALQMDDQSSWVACRRAYQPTF